LQLEATPFVSRFGLVWFGLVWFGLVWFGLVWFGLVWFGGTFLEPTSSTYKAMSIRIVRIALMVFFGIIQGILSLNLHL